MARYTYGNGVPTWNGVPMIGGVPFTEGKYFFVDADIGSDGNKGLDSSKPFATVAKAYSAVTSNNNDVIVLMGSGTHVLTEMLTVAKNRVHFIGMDGTSRKFGQSAKIKLGVTSAVTDIATVLVTGVRCSFDNIKFISDNTLTEGLYCVIDAGEYTVFSNFEIYKSTHLTVTTASELVCNGDSSQYINGTIGSLANAQTGTTIRPCVALNNNLAPSGSSQMRECYFENVRMLKHSGHSTSAFVYATADADVERTLEFRDCVFINAILSAATPAVAVVSAATLTVGQILLTGSTAEINCDALATATGIWSALPTYAAAGGSAIQAT